MMNRRRSLAVLLSILICAVVTAGIVVRKTTTADSKSKTCTIGDYTWYFDAETINDVNYAINIHLIEDDVAASSNLILPDAFSVSGTNYYIKSLGLKDLANQDSFFVSTDIGAYVTVDATSCTKLTTVNNYAFYGESYLTVKLPQTVSYIGANTFCEGGSNTVSCSNPNIQFGGNDVTTVNFRFTGTENSTAYERYYAAGKFKSNGQTAKKVTLTSGSDDVSLTSGILQNYAYILDLTYAGQTKLLSVPVRKNYTFLGYYTQSGTKIFDGSGNLVSVDVSHNEELVGKWEGKPYSIRYEGGKDARGSMETQTVRYGDVFNLLDAAFTRAGYTFAGWQDVSGNSYTTTKNYSNLLEPDAKTDTDTDTSDTETSNPETSEPDSSEPDASVTMYAQWTENSYTVKFNGNGADSGVMSDVTTKYSDTITLAKSTYKRTGYTFAGWAKTKDGTEAEYADGVNVSKLAESGTVTLYAVWQENSYTITYDGSGADSGTMSDVTTEYTKTITLAKNTYKRNGYTFNGWTETKDGTEAEYADGAGVSKLAESGTVTLYAVWESNYTITYDAGGGTGDMADQTVSFSEKVTISENAFTKTGYTFQSWNTKSDGTGTAYDAGAEVSGLTESESVTLYAQWAAHGYVVLLNNNGGEGTLSNVRTYYDAGTKVNAGSLITRTGCKLLGWTTKKINNPLSADADLSDVTYYADDKALPNLTEKNNVSIVLYALWQYEKYTITYNMTQKDATFSSKPESYVYGDSVTLPVPTLTGYTFAGWTDENGKAVSEISKTDTGDKTFNDSWTVNSHTISFEGIGLKKVSLNNKALEDYKTTCVYGSDPGSFSILLTSTVRATGYKIVNPDTDEVLETGEISGNDFTITPKITMPDYDIQVLVETENESYAITYETGGGTFTSDPPETYQYGKGLTLPTNLEKTGYTFNGWQDGSGDKITEIGTDETGSRKFYAIWKLAQYALTVDSGGGTFPEGTKIPESYSYDSGTISLPEPEREGYTFTGWYNDTLNSFITEIDTAVTQPQSITAKWSNNSTTYYELVTVTENGSETKLSLAQTGMAESINAYYYGNLSQIEQRIYTTLYEHYAFNMNDGICTADSVLLVSETEFTSADLYDASMSMVRDHPEIFWIRCMYFSNPKQNEDGSWTCAAYPNFAYDSVSFQSDAKEYKGNFDEIINALEQEGISKADTYNKLKLIYKQICERYKYRNNSKILNATTTNETRAVGYMLSHKEGCCESYAKIMKVLCDYYNIPCVTLVSSTHMWDAVKISGTWYMADPTWDDAGNTAVYNYFLKGTNYYADKDHKLQNTNFFDGNGNPITEDGITEPPEISAEDYQYTSSASKKVTPITSAKTKTVSGIVYKINGKTATVQKASSKKIKSAVIAAKVKIGGKTYKVTSISANAFKGCRKLAKVTIKSTSLKSIGRNAFKGIKKTAVFKTGKKKYKKYKKLIAKKTTGYTKKMKIKK